MIPKRQSESVARVETPALAPVDQAPRHLHPIDSDRKGAKFAALDHDVARVLGPQRGAAVLYGFLASTWFEYADPTKLAERRKKFTPGDWVEVSYDQFMEIGGTRARSSIIRWLRILAEDCHPCPWSRCADEHPLVVVHRQGQSKLNRYRKWRCGEDTLVVRRRVRSEKLREVARRRVAAGQQLNGIDGPSRPSMDVQPVAPDSQLALLEAGAAVESPESLKSRHETTDTDRTELPEVSWRDDQKSRSETTGSLVAELPEVSLQDSQKSRGETSLRVKTLNNDIAELVGNLSNTAKSPDAIAAVEEVTDEEAVACEVVDAVLSLAQRVDPEYHGDTAWAVARKLASSALQTHDGDCEPARAALLVAIKDPRLARATNPIGLLIRGVVGDKNGRDRYLLKSPSAAPTATNAPAIQQTRYETSTRLPPGQHDALLEAIRSGTQITKSWMKERNVSYWAYERAREEVAAELEEVESATPLANELEVADPVLFEMRMEAILYDLPIVKSLGIEPSLDSAMLRGLCLAQLERELKAETG